MNLTLFYHPISSFSWKVLIALYESGVPFRPQVVDFGDPASREALFRLWPIGKIPVLRDDDSGEAVAETSIILERLAQRFETARWLLPDEPGARLEVRLRDRVFDLHLHAPMQRIVADRLRPSGARDTHGVAQARRDLATGCAVAEGWLEPTGWAAGPEFTLADCAAAPALYYADKVAPFGTTFPHCAGYLQRISARPSFARVLAEAAPFAGLFPEE